MQPKDRPNGWAFLGTSLPLFPFLHRASLSLAPSESSLPPTFTPPYFPVPSAQASNTPTFLFSPSEGSSLCLAGVRFGTLAIDRASLPEAAARPRPSVSLEREGAAVEGILELLAGPSSQVFWRLMILQKGPGCLSRGACFYLLLAE